LKDALSLNPDDTETIRQIADLYREKKEYGSAMALYRKVIKLKPDLAIARVGLGYCLLESDKAQQALEQFDQAIRTDARNPNAYFGLAQAYNKLGMLPEEIQSYQALLTLEPNLAAARQNLGNALHASKAYQEAIEQYSLAIQLQPNNAGLYFNTGAAYKSLEQYDKAIGYFRKALELDPQNAAAHNALAISYYMLKQLDQAKTHAAAAKQLGYPVQKELLKALDL
jgi:tetratricopeptide (TPR) repeat protein